MMTVDGANTTGSGDASGRRPRGLLIHVGYHKTGTTWLQKSLFCDEMAGFCQPWTRGEIHKWLILVNALSFDGEAARAYFESGRRESLGRGLAPVVTAERLSGNPHSGGYDSRELADRLHATFPDDLVLVVIREQKSMILSAYRQYVRVGGTGSLKRYMHPPVNGKSRMPMFGIEYFEYDRLIAYYQARFGADRVLVLPYELLKNDVESFASSITGFVGIDCPAEIRRERANLGLSGLAVHIKRPVNFFLVRDRVNPSALIHHPKINLAVKRTFNNLDRATPVAVHRWFSRRMGAYVERQVGRHYQDCNRRIQELTGLDLGRYGYCV